MNDDLENLKRRQDNLDDRVGTLETGLDEQANLRAAMDEDLSKLRVDLKMLQSLHDTQQEHNAKIELLRIDMESGFERVHVGFERVHVGIEAIRDLLTRDLTQEA